MAAFIIEAPHGKIDGTNRVFKLAAAYVRGSVTVFMNGLALIRTSENGWTELGDKKIRLRLAPQNGDSVRVMYRPI